MAQVKSLIEFQDKSGADVTRSKKEILNDIVLYIQDESDFYQAWERVFSDENIENYENDEDGLRYKARSTTWIESLPEVLTFQM